MNERWVCKRCFEANDGSAGTCAKCGLLRGSEVAASDQGQWAEAAGPATAPTTAPSAGWTKWLKFAWIPVVVVVLAVGYFANARRDSSGEIEAGGTLSVTDLQVGDCFDLGELELITDVEAVPCDEAHEYEVYHVQDYPTASFPTDTEMQSITDEICLGTFEAYVGMDYANSTLFALPITPSGSSFADGDREYVCVLYDPENSELTSSMEDANR